MPRTRLSAVAPLDRCDSLSNALQRSQSLLAQAEDLGQFGIWEFEIPGLKLTCSPKTYQIFEHPLQPLLNLDTFFSFFDPDAAATIRGCFLAAFSVATAVDETLRFRTATGRPGWLRIMARATVATSGRRHIVGLVKDVTREREAEQHLRLLAYQDGLTGLPNRMSFESELSEFMAEAAPDLPFALMLIDLDEYSSVSDRQGHARSDAVLTEIARRLGAAISKADRIARIGNAEFAILMPEIDSAAAAGRAAAALRESVARGRREAAQPSPSFSMGISLYPGDGTRPAELYDAADLALCRAKAQGRNRTAVFCREIRDELQVTQRLNIELRQALQARQLCLLYQPIVDLNSRAIQGWEALLRWQHPARGLLLPAMFLPQIENRQLAIDVDRYVLDQALAELRRWLDGGHAVPCISLNVSAEGLRREDFVEALAEALRRHDLTPDRLRIEIPEAAFFAQNLDSVTETIARLSHLGVVCALDHFGAGTAALTHLKRFKIQRVKLDGALIAMITIDPHDRAIAQSIINIARKIGLKVTAEGIETPDQLHSLMAFACDCGQGALFGPPIPAEAVPALLAAWNGGRAAEILGRWRDAAG